MTVMSNVAFLFAGQGSQAPGMGHDLYRAYPEFREAFDAADPTGKVAQLCFEATAEELGQTRNTQPALVAECVAIAALLKSRGVRPAMAAGLSLGEYAALCAAGVFQPQQAVQLVAFRGQAMERASAGIACGMTAVLGMEPAQVMDACAQACALTGGVVEPANYNAPGQIVISGEDTAVRAATDILRKMGAKRCMPLDVSGPFHTSLMKPAADQLRDRFANEPFGELQIPVVFNATGQVLQPGQSIPQLLERQVQSSVRFDQSVRTMVDAGITVFVEIGPGKTLSKLVRRIDKSCTVLNVGDVASFEATIDALKGSSDE